MMCSPGVAMDVLLSARDMVESQRSFELRKVFAPEQSSSAGIETSFNDNLNNDGALDAYAETIIWRLRAVHAMVSLVDRGHQYFLAGAVRETHFEQEDDEDDVISQQQWFGCDSVPTPGGLCENTLGLDTSTEEYPCFIINDLSQDARFKDLPVVNGTVSSYRFYAGTPITTVHGVNIGSFFMFDNKPRDGLSRSQRKFLRQQATNIMKHLATKREAAERRRAALMSKGIAKFLDKTAQYREYGIGDTSESVDDPTPSRRVHVEQVVDGVETTTASPAIDDFPARSSVLDRIRMTLDQAAEILRESLEITTGGAVFLDTSLANSEMEEGDEIVRLIAEDPNILIDEGNSLQIPDIPLRPPFNSVGSDTGRHLSQGLIRSSADKHKPPKILAASVPKDDLWDPTVPILNSKTLAALIKSYPKGNVWSIDGEGYYTSLEQIANWERIGMHDPAERKSSISVEDLTRQRFEAALLSHIFKKARQIIFLPLWDAGANKWYSGCFIWSQSTVPVFTVESELTYLSAFTNSMMVEISRLDAITANKMKSDFIGSISHEFRSPLHGILVSAEFLRDSLLDSSQSELVATIQNCSGTLLDTINHVLDYSKINTFEISSNQEGPVSQLYQATNLALLCESVVEGMVAANSFRGNSLDDVPLSSKSEILSPRRHQEPQHNSNLEIILDIEERDWDYNVEPGSLQRVLMNLLGNSQKFTAQGYIIIQLRILEMEDEDTTKPGTSILSLTIKDSGKGMSTEFMERKLYRPFAQEDSFVPGVGLGLSIVWSIVNQYGGKIHVRSEQGKGTDIEVNLAVEKAHEPSHTLYQQGELIKVPQDAEQLVLQVRKRAIGKKVSFSRRYMACIPAHRELSWECIERYLTTWFGFEVTESEADIVITNQHDLVRYTSDQRSLIIHEDAYYPGSRSSNGVASLCNPIGPFKLARCILSLMDQEFPIEVSTSETVCSRSDIGTQTPSGTPAERTILNGIIMTDYGFTPGTSVSSKDAATPLLAGENTDEQADSYPAMPLSPGMMLRLPIRKPTLNSIHPSITETLNIPTLAPSSPKSTSLPASPPKSPANLASLTPKTPVKPKSRSLRILAVDDNTLNLQLLHRYLLKRKQDVVTTATNGLEALNAVRKARNEENFDIVFMDISMPEMDGFESTRLIRSFERSQLHRSISDFHALKRTTSDHEPVNGPGHANRFEITTQCDGNGECSHVLHESGVYGEPEGQLEGFTLDVNEVGLRDRRSRRAFIVALTGLASRRDRDLAEQSGFDDFLTKPISFKRIGELLDRISEVGGGA